MIPIPNYPGFFVSNTPEYILIALAGALFGAYVVGITALVLKQLRKKKEWLKTLSDAEYRKYKETFQ